VEDSAAVSEFLATLAAAFVTVIELNLQSLGYFSGILELAIGQVTLWRAGRLDMFFISFVMVRNVNCSVNYKQYAFPANLRRSGHRLGRKDRSPNQALFVLRKRRLGFGF
jgi:hypothetical protein